MDKKGILIVTSYSLPSYAGGGRNAWYFARFLNENNHNNLILTFNRGLKLKKRDIIDGVNIFRIPYFNLNILTKVISFILFIWPLYLINVFKSNCIYLVGANIIGYQSLIWMGYFLGRKVVFRSTLMDYDDYHSLTSGTGLIRSINLNTLRKIHTYISINPEFTRSLQMSDVKTNNIIQASQGVDISSFLPISSDTKNKLRKKYGIPVESFVILSVGSIIKRKGFPESFKFLSQLDNEFIYMVVGETSYQAGHFMSSFIEETDEILHIGKSLLKERLLLIGAVNNISEIYGVSDLLLINSNQEGTPNVLLEAMASGLPILCRTMDGIAEHLVF